MELFDPLARGAVGSITASAHLNTALFVRLFGLMQTGQLDAARKLWRGLRPLTSAAFAEPNPAPLKAALARQGWLQNELRAPMWPASEGTADGLMATVAAAELASGAAAKPSTFG